MSHFTKIKTKIYDLEILKKSLTDLNLEFTAENLEINGYNNQKASADLIIKQSNNYDIGFKWNNILPSAILLTCSFNLFL